MKQLESVVHQEAAASNGITATSREEAHALTRRGLLKLVMGAGLGLVAANAVPGIAFADGTLSRDGVKARFFIGSDLHMQNQGKDDESSDITGAEGRDADKKLLYAFDVAYSLDPQLDAFCLVGDITDNGRISQYKKVMSLLANPRNKANSNNHTKVILCQGNHETYTVGAAKAPARFKDQTGQDANKVVDVNGVKVITMGPNTKQDDWYVENYAWFKDQLDKEIAGSSAPFLVLTHHQIKGSTYTSPEWNGHFGEGTNQDIVKLMGEYPNLVQVSGHSHATTEDERSISQDLGFTAIQDATIGAYYENETGKVDPESGDGASVPPQTSPAYTAGKDIPEASQAVILDFMENGQVKAYRISLVRSKLEGKVVYLYEPWVIDVPALVQAKGNLKDTATWKYTSARQSTAAPKFPAGAQVTVDNVTDKSAVVHFPTAQPGSDSNLDMVHEYKIVATAADGSKVQHRVFNDYYRPLAYLRKTWDVKFKGLKPSTNYTIALVAQTSWNKEEGSEGSGTWAGATKAAVNSTSQALSSEPFTTKEAPKAPDFILNIDYRTGSAEDADGHAVSELGGQLNDDDTIYAGAVTRVFQADGKAGFGYQLTEDDYDFYKAASTTEVYYKIPADADVSKGGDNCIFSNQQGAGSGFETSKGKLQFWYHDENLGDYVVPETDAVAGQWVHAVAVADGKNLTLYVDGKQVDQKAAGAMTVPGPKMFYVGCDTDGGEGPSAPIFAGTRIALARLYPRAFTAEQVAALYQEVQAGKKQDADAQQAAKDLQAEIDAIKADQSKYTAETWAAFAASLASYEELAANGKATKDELTKALDELKAKYAAAQSDGTLKPVEQQGGKGGNQQPGNGNKGGTGNNNAGNGSKPGAGNGANNGGSNKKPAGTPKKTSGAALPQTGDPFSIAALGGTAVAGLGAIFAGLKGRKAASTASADAANDDPASDDSDLD